jgi:hypothetical protein
MYMLLAFAVLAMLSFQRVEYTNGDVLTLIVLLLHTLLMRRLMSPALLLIVLLCLASLVGVYVTRERNYVVADGQFVFDVQTKLTAIAVVTVGLLYLSGNLFTLQLPVFLGGIRKFTSALAYHIHDDIHPAQRASLLDSDMPSGL